MSKFIAFYLILGSILGCASTKKKIADQVGCDENEITMSEESHSPIHGEYIVTCKGKIYSCVKTPVYRQCKEKDAK